MTSDIIEPPPVVAVEDEDPAVIIAWLDGPEGDVWLRSRAQRPFWTGPDPALPRKQAPGDVAEDPCGRPPGVGVENAAREGAG